MLRLCNLAVASTDFAACCGVSAEPAVIATDPGGVAALGKRPLTIPFRRAGVVVPDVGVQFYSMSHLADVPVVARLAAASSSLSNRACSSLPDRQSLTNVRRMLMKKGPGEAPLGAAQCSRWPVLLARPN